MRKRARFEILRINDPAIMEFSVNRSSAKRRWPTEALIFLLAFPPSVYGQQGPAPPLAKPMGQLPVVQNLKLIPLAGKDEMNALERHVMAPLVVDVLDQNDRPVEGADVVFRFPLKGPGATFANEKTSQTFRTNAQGEAAATGWTANSEVGRFQVHATATYGNQMGEITFSMSNVTRIVEGGKKGHRQPQWWSTRKFKIAVIAGGAALVAGIVLAKEVGGGGSSKTSTAPTVTITPGSPSVGGP
jgi:hypothetical protein